MDLSYRRNASLISSNFSAQDNQGARGDTWHLVVNGLWLLPRTAYFDTGNFIAEMAYSRVQRVTDHKDLFKGEGYAGCPAGQDKAWGAPRATTWASPSASRHSGLASSPAGTFPRR